MDTQILRLPVVLKMRAKSRSSHYSDIQRGLFTKPVKIGARAVGWPASELSKISAAQIAGNTQEEIRALVTKLEQLRQNGRWVTADE